jgi:hypothetical protein
MNYKQSIGVLLLIAMSPGVLAQNPALTGVFVNPAQSSKSIEAAIEVATKEFNFVARPIARSRLKKHSPAITRVEIGQGDAITIKLGDAKPTIHSPSQPPVKWTRPDGEVFNVTMQWQGATLLQTFESEEGTRVNRYSLSADGQQLMMDVTLTGPQLKRAVKYMLMYTRDGQK